MQNKIYILLLLAICCFSACNKRPKEILSEDKMEAVMVDLYVFEGSATVKRIPAGDSIKTQYYNSIFKKHNITLAQYDSTLMWYIKNIKEYDKLNEKVLAGLNKLKKNIDAGKYIRPIAPNDSIDSMLIEIPRKEYVMSKGSPKESSRYSITNKKIQGGDKILLHFIMRVDGDTKGIKALAKLIVHYTDSTTSEKNVSLAPKVKPAKYEILISTDKKKKVSRLTGDLFEYKPMLDETQRVVIDQVVLLRKFNPYRKKK